MKNKQSLAEAVALAGGKQTAAKEVKPPAESSDKQPSKQRQANRVGKKVISGYFAPEVSKKLRKLALDQDTTVEELLGTALNLLFKANGIDEVV